MHVLIIPSEEFIPERDHMLGIFQYHQAKILVNRSHQVGVISVRLTTSWLHDFKVRLLSLFKSPNKYHFKSCINFFTSSLLSNNILSHSNTEGINIIRVSGWYLFPPYRKLESFFWCKYCRKAYNQYIRQYGKPDIIYAHNALYAGLFSSDIKETLIPVVLVEHSSGIGNHSFSSSLIKKVKRAYNGATTLLAVSDYLKEGMKRYTGNIPIQSIGNTTDPVFEEKPLTQNRKEFDFISIGSLFKNKNHQLILRSFAEFLKKYPKAKLVIIGNGDQYLALNQLKKELDIPNENLLFAGTLSQKEIIEYLDKSNILLHSSFYETFGVSLIEALFRGLPVLTTNCGGPSMFINQSNGIICEKEPGSYTNALFHIYEHIGSYNRVEIRNQIISKYGQVAFANLLEEIFTTSKPK